MSSNTLAIFPAKAPVETNAPNQDRLSDNESGFKSFMDNAAHKSNKPNKPSNENSSQNHNDSKTQKAQSSKSKNSSNKEDKSNYHEVSVSKSTDENSTWVSKSLTKGSIKEDTEIFASQLHELEINQDRFNDLLDFLGLNGEVNMEALLHSLSQTLNLSSDNTIENFNSKDFLTNIQQDKKEVVNFLKQAGLSDSEAKNLLNKFQSLLTLSTQERLNNDIIDDNLDFSTHIKKITNESEKTDPLLKEVEKKIDPLLKEAEKKIDPLLKDVELKDPISNKVQNIKRSNSSAKPSETLKYNDTPRITSQDSIIEKPDKFFNVSELLGDKNSQANIVQKEIFNKSLDTVKTTPDLQIQPPASTSNTIIKAVESSKPILPENLLTRGATETQIIKQVTDKMTIRSNGTENEVHIKLDPPSLGRVRMNITTSGDSVRTVIVAENQAVKQVIENNFNQLRDAMDEQGLKVDSLTVTVGGESNQQNSSGDFSGKEDDSTAFEQPTFNDTDELLDNGTVSLFLGDNQSISVIV
jgi:flagellar hook-length control protein FliK